MSIESDVLESKAVSLDLSSKGNGADTRRCTGISYIIIWLLRTDNDLWAYFNKRERDISPCY